MEDSSMHMGSGNMDSSMDMMGNMSPLDMSSLAAPNSQSIPHSHSHTHSSHSMSEGMPMTFFSSIHTPLYFHAWTPRNSGEFAGSCVFLIVVATLLRALFVLKGMLEARSLARSRSPLLSFKQQYPSQSNPSLAQNSMIRSASMEKESLSPLKDSPSDGRTVTGVPESGNMMYSNPSLEDGALTSKSKGRNFPGSGYLAASQSWKFTTDVPRAFLITFITTLSYFIMLAVMTMNVGYFCSVLAGTFLGELLIGRFGQTAEIHH